MKQIKVSPNNEMYYSDDFIKGFNEGAKRQFEADMADRKTENSSEIPNNCEPQTQLVNDSPILVKDLVDDEFNPYDEECMRCKHLKLRCEFVPSYCKYEPRDEPQTDGYISGEDFMKIFDEPQTERSK